MFCLKNNTEFVVGEKNLKQLLDFSKCNHNILLGRPKQAVISRGTAGFNLICPKYFSLVMLTVNPSQAPVLLVISQIFFFFPYICFKFVKLSDRIGFVFTVVLFLHSYISPYSDLIIIYIQYQLFDGCHSYTCEDQHTLS